MSERIKITKKWIDGIRGTIVPSRDFLFSKTEYTANQTESTDEGFTTSPEAASICLNCTRARCNGNCQKWKTERVKAREEYERRIQK